MMHTATGTPAEPFARDVARDLQLTPKQLQSKYLYDALGSSLFDAICRLPWYRITRAENRLLARHGPAIARQLWSADVHPTIVELGCGNGEKLVILAEALQSVGGSAHVHLIDISPQALAQTEERLTRLRHFSVVGHQSTYEDGLRRASSQRRSGSPVLVLLLGSNIGNFDAPASHEFLRSIRDALAPGDLLLLGADLVKPAADLILAYDDPLGVTAAFNKNLLVRINRELGGSFDLAAFDHRAAWNADLQRIEMHLVCRRPHVVTIPAARLDVPFVEGEWIWTESSYKYTEGEIVDRGMEADFAVSELWIEQDSRFALTLFRAV
jgi:dimethylhistidine N-methyltransferase